MAIYHLNLSHISRGKGQLVCASAAYRAAEKIYDHRNGKLHDYSRKTGVHDSEILAPSYAPEWVYDREELWNSVESFERRKNSRTASEIDVAIPVELDNNQKINLVRDFSKIFTDRGLIADVAYHDFNSHNPHAHILISTRSISEQGWTPNKDQGIQKRNFLEELRSSWEKLANQYLENSNSKQRIDHRTLEAQGINRVPQIHLGPNVSHMEAKGIETDRGDEWRDIIHANNQINDLSNTKRDLDYEKQLLEQLIEQTDSSEKNSNQSEAKAQPNFLKNFFSKFQKEETEPNSELDNDDLEIYSPHLWLDQFPIHDSNPLASKSIADLSPKDGKRIKEKQAINLHHHYQPFFNQVADQADIIGSKQIQVKLGNQNNQSRWCIGINADDTEFWMINESKQQTKIHLQLTENNELWLEYNVNLGEFDQLVAAMPKQLNPKINAYIANKQKEDQQQREVAETVKQNQQKEKEQQLKQLYNKIQSVYEQQESNPLYLPESINEQLREIFISTSEESEYFISQESGGYSLRQLDPMKGIDKQSKNVSTEKLFLAPEAENCKESIYRVQRKNLLDMNWQLNEEEELEQIHHQEQKQQQRKRIEEENRRIQEEEQRKQQQQKSTKRKQKRQQQKPNQDWEL